MSSLDSTFGVSLKPYVPPPVAGYVAWWDASDMSSVTLGSGSSDVSQWNDKSGSGFHGTQGSAALRPALAVHQTYGRRNTLLAFDGSDRFATSAPADDRTQTVFAMGVCSSLADYRTIVGASNNAGRQLRINQTTGTITCNSQATSTIITTTTLAVVVGTPFVVCLRMDAANAEIRLNNGTPETAANATTFTAGRTTPIGENSSSGGVERFAGLLGEILIYGTSLSSGDIDSVMAYLMTKWGVS